MMETNEANGDMNSDYITKSRTSNNDNIKMSSNMLNNFSVERILSESTQPANHNKNNSGNGLYVHRKRRILDESINSVLFRSNRCIDEAKHPRISSAVDSSAENKLDLSGKLL